MAWSDVQVGDILLLKNRESVPADLLVRGLSSDPSGVSGGGSGGQGKERRSMKGSLSGFALCVSRPSEIFKSNYCNGLADRSNRP